MASNPNNQPFRAPPTGTPLDDGDLRRLQQAVNSVRGLHKDTLSKSMVLASNDRLLLLGSQDIPAGVTVQLISGAVMQVL